MATDKGITLYTSGTPNGWKASILLEELQIPYKVHAISLSKMEQKEDWFVKINPNGRIPALGALLLHGIQCLTQLIELSCHVMTDNAPNPTYTSPLHRCQAHLGSFRMCTCATKPCHAVDHDEGDLPVFESGAIMVYLADKDSNNTFLPRDVRKRAEIMSWLMFQMVTPYTHIMR